MSYCIDAHVGASFFESEKMHTTFIAKPSELLRNKICVEQVERNGPEALRFEHTYFYNFDRDLPRPSNTFQSPLIFLETCLRLTHEA